MNKEGPGFLGISFNLFKHSDYDDIVSWNDNGDGFQVKDINIFQNDILPNYFKHSNFASFVRQLNMYDFHKTEKNSFKHKLFKRNQKELLPQIKRKVNDQIIILPNIEQINQDLSMLTLRNQELESLFTYIIQQSDKLKKENAFLWQELIKIKQKNDHQQEKLFDWLTNNITAESLFKILEKSITKRDLIKLVTRVFGQDQQNKKIKKDYII
ncbi:unnamed protein product (macronuclear) [Paramecium tetraurelia]|uniref:HSF-type DNA-binding domain-containing protein n=1 Tax=Paramecium tetraurelia TaxID=5888 RepID=A0C6W8_PARTE|nr:uncharacterized protein GSPATT00035664001 [Paramecium tetraurelia]CAK66535.1 unnamed protein product [Paramecium tetraurelia]|eukprot:XP_001433932.1 hypothetical protein (macronuclear) [Paramecium tetraurelia strain d4-2]